MLIVCFFAVWRGDILEKHVRQHSDVNRNQMQLSDNAKSQVAYMYNQTVWLTTGFHL